MGLERDFLTQNGSELSQCILMWFLILKPFTEEKKNYFSDQISKGKIIVVTPS